MKFEKLSSGNSVEKREINAFRSTKGAPPFVYLIAGVHGDEIEGIHVLDKLFSWIKDNEFPFSLIVVPVVNPDGLFHKIRQNVNGVDLNRNLPTKDWSIKCDDRKYYPGPYPLSEPENEFLENLFQKFPPSFIMSFHSWVPMLNYNGECKAIADFLSQYNNYEVTGTVGYPTPGSLGTFGPEKYDAPVLTLEFPMLQDSEKSLQQIWVENEKGLKSLFTSKKSPLTTLNTR